MGFGIHPGHRPPATACITESLVVGHDHLGERHFVYHFESRLMGLSQTVRCNTEGRSVWYMPECPGRLTGCNGKNLAVLYSVWKNLTIELAAHEEPV